MKTLIKDDLRELDAWIAKHLFQYGDYVGLMKRGLWYRTAGAGYTSDEAQAGKYLIGDAIKQTTDPSLEDAVKVQSFSIPYYTADQEAAMTVLERCAEEREPIKIYRRLVDDMWDISANASQERCERFVTATGETLPLAICRFAKALFAKT